jgi:threonine dehydrogenase-like Zn-dependent dehydrogenase
MNPDSLVLLMVLPEWVPTVADTEYLRVPHGDFNCLKLPEDAVEKQNDYVMLSDVFPTGYHATELAGV